MHEMVFVGTPVAALAIVGFLRRAPGTALGRWLALGTLLVTIGTAALWIPYHLVPGFAYFRPLGRALFLWCFAVALLGGIGLDGLVRWSRRPRLPRSTGERVTRTLIRHRGAVGAAALVVGVGAIAWTADQLIVYGRKINPPFQPRRAAYLYPETPAVNALLRERNTRPETEPMRILPIRRDAIGVPFTPPTMYASHSMVFQIESGAGYESLFPNRIADVWRVVGGETPEHVLAVKQLGAYFPSFLVNSTRFDLLSRLGVTTLFVAPDVDQEATWKPSRYAPLKLDQIYSGADGKVFDIRNTAPRAYVVYRTEVVANSRDAFVRFTSRSFPFRRSVIFERRGAPPTLQSKPAAAVGPAARMTHVSANSETYTVTTARRGWLVIGSMWSPGWQATVNRHSTAVRRADFNLRAVELPAGRSTVKLEYRPPGLIAGATLSLATLLSVLVLLVAGAVRRRRKPSDA
jgi:hypothetical protein